MTSLLSTGFLILLPILLLCQFVLTALPVDEAARVNLVQGFVVGIEERSTNGRLFYSFLGIPYAQPPLGDLRFKDPLRHLGWSKEGLRSAHMYRPSCPQWDSINNQLVGSEDCLYLNIHTRNITPASATNPNLHVMVFIHGGGFVKGGAQMHGPHRLMERDKVLVTVQYRLGILGFLSTEDKAAPGNYGMMDLVLALKWIQKNIHHFGGDPRKVTIFGNSAGAAAVTHLILSPLASGLFSAAMAQSGSSVCDWALEEHPKEYALSVAKELECAESDDDDAQEIIECLRDKSIADLIRVQNKQHMLGSLPLRTAPIVDSGFRSNPFLPDLPMELLRSGNFSRVPLLGGVVKDEGLLLYLQFLLKNGRSLRNGTYVQQILLPEFLDIMVSDSFDKEELLEATKTLYLSDVKSFRDLVVAIPAMVQMIGDLFATHCTDVFLKLHSDHVINDTYAYVFNFVNNQTMFQKLIDRAVAEGTPRALLDKFVNHADELGYLFNISEFGDLHTHEAKRTSYMITSLWNSFANHRNPTPKLPPIMRELPSAPIWEPFSKERRDYYFINDQPTMNGPYRRAELRAWSYALGVAEKSARQTMAAEDTDALPYELLLWIAIGVAGFFLLMSLICCICLIVTRRSR